MLSECVQCGLVQCGVAWFGVVCEGLPIWSTTWFQSGKMGEGVGHPLATRASRSEVRMATMRSDMILSSLHRFLDGQLEAVLYTAFPPKPKSQGRDCLTEQVKRRRKDLVLLGKRHQGEGG